MSGPLGAELIDLGRPGGPVVLLRGDSDLPFPLVIEHAIGVEAKEPIFATTAAANVLKTAAGVLGECQAKGAA